jgi:hypothetical protein
MAESLAQIKDRLMIRNLRERAAAIRDKYSSPDSSIDERAYRSDYPLQRLRRFNNTDEEALNKFLFHNR